MTATDPFAAQRALVTRQGGWFIDRPHHALSWLPGRGERLVVTFDNLAALRETENRSPWGQAFLAAQGWDVLGVMTRRNDWFRDVTLWTALESLRDDGFFRRFAAVSMYGASMGAFAALAFAPLAPGCTVFAMAPQSTLCPRRAPFENRYRQARAFTDWSGPWADAAEGHLAASRAYVAFDPHVPQDAAHVARLTGPNVTLLRLPHIGHKLPPALQKMKILKPVSMAALTGTLTAGEFARLFRARHASTPWQTDLLSRARARGHLKLAHRLALHLMAETPHWRLRHELAAITEAMAAANLPADQDGALAKRR